MAVFNRVYCPACKKGHNIYDENLKKIDCSCGEQAAIKANEKNFFIDYVCLMESAAGKGFGSSRKLAEDVLSKRRIEIV